MSAVRFWRAEGWGPALAGTTVQHVTRSLRLVAWALLLVAGVLPARADDLTAAIAGLGGASFAEKEKAIVAIGRSGDPRAVPILQALSGDRLRKTPDGRVIMVDAIGPDAKLT